MDNVAVIIPAYNAADTLARCLDSVVGQQHVGVVVVVDDGSTDSTAAVAAAYAPAVRLISHGANRGRVAARATGLQAALASGAGWVTMVDADDELAPGAIRYALDAGTDADVVQMSVRMQGRRLSMLRRPANADRALYAAVADERIFPVSVWGKLIRAAALPPADSPLTSAPLSWGEDRLWCIALFERSPRVAVCRRAEYVYHIDSADSQQGARPHLEQMKRVHAAKRRWAEATGRCSWLDAIDAELLRLLRYEVRMAMNRGDFDSAALAAELAGEPWRQMSAPPDAVRIERRERRSLMRVIKAAAKRLF